MRPAAFPGGRMSALRILVADDHELVRRGVRSLLEANEGWIVCGEAGDGSEAVEKTRELKPDIVILDVGMPRLNGLEAARQILRYNPGQRVLILTITATEEMARAALEAGAKAYVLKSDGGRDLIAAVCALQHGRTFFTSLAAQMVLNGYLTGIRAVKGEFTSRSLTLREREVVQLLAEGRSTKAVAVLLKLSVKTVETHRNNIMRKVNVHSVAELVLYAARNDIVQVCSPSAALST
jgi:DNA-binding NarL/FixJ family response regulator